MSRALRVTRQGKDKVHTMYLTSDTTTQKTVELEELSNVPCTMTEHIHIWKRLFGRQLPFKNMNNCNENRSETKLH